MKIGLTISSNISDTSIIEKLSKELEIFFKEKNYGNSIKTYLIGVICVSPQFEQFFKIRKPVYTQGKKELKMHGIYFTIENSFSCNIKLDFDTFKNASELEAKEILAKEILLSLKVLDGMKKKIKDFDIEKFKNDLEDYFRNEGLV